VHEREACWRVAVDSKFGSSWGGWCTLKPSREFRVGLWKNIRKAWGKILCHTRIEVKYGSKIKF
jgi:hypothetical protein